jgi:hypothetical protein
VEKGNSQRTLIKNQAGVRFPVALSPEHLLLAGQWFLAFLFVGSLLIIIREFIRAKRRKG